MKPYLDDGDLQVYNGDALAVLSELPSESVDCCVTSPPYWGLRDYGTATWKDGDADCEHSIGGQVTQTKDRGTERDGAIVGGVRPGVDASSCRKCGALRVDSQLGLEHTPEQFVSAMVEVFDGVRRVLRKDGTLWLNIGDSYNAYNGGAGPGSKLSQTQTDQRPNLATGFGLQCKSLKPKDLVGIPWRLAFALQADGWYLRSEVIWAKPNPMPESIKDRPTKAHEQVFLLARSARYFYDQDSAREPYLDESGTQRPNVWPDGWAHEGSHNVIDHSRRGRGPDGRKKTTVTAADGSLQHRDGERWPNALGRNMRSVWTITPEPYPDAHFATFPTELARRCIVTGCPERGTVLDPFLGSGTTALVARRLNRRCIGIELNADYCALAARRTQQLSLEASA